MSNSQLCTYVNLSPNHSGLRVHPIDTITPHCTAGRCNIETLGNIFAQASRQASSNYGIDDTGQIGLFVPEENRSWCSSSSANDNRAITIECSSESVHPYAMNEAVFSALIDLTVDICRRNGKTKLKWFGDKDSTLAYQPKANEMVITLHRWFSARACPGDWLVSRLGEYADRVNARLAGLNTEPKYRVQVGAFTTLEQAQTALRELQERGFVQAKIVKN